MSDAGEDDDANGSGTQRDATVPGTLRERLPIATSARGVSTAPDFGDRYRVLGRLGKGGMGEVFRAYDAELKGEVALKIVREDKSDPGAMLARFRREIALARRITNPNVLRIYDLAEHDGLRFVSMEYIEGDDLATLLRRGRLPVDKALAIFCQVCRGLIAAHDEGIVHRDLKPQNVLVDKEGSVRVADFGLARSLGESGMTATGAVLGSPAYMSPEQVRGDPVDERSDIYSLGIMLYQLVGGETPFQASSPHAVMSMRLHKTPAPLRTVNPEVPAYLESITARCLALEPGDRYASVRALLADLEAARAPAGAQSTASVTSPTRLPRWVVPAASAAIAAGVVLVAVKFVRSPGSAGDQSGGSTAPPSAPTLAPAEPLASAPGQITTLVLGFENRTGNPTFDGTLDEAMDSALRRSVRVDPIARFHLTQLAAELAAEPLPLDDRLAATLAARDHSRVVAVHGAIVPKGAAFTLSISLHDVATGTVVDRSVEAASVDKVLPAIGRLASAIREAAGESVPPGEVELTGLSSNIDAVHELAVARGLSSTAGTAASIPHFQAALAKDPDLALAHQQLGIDYVDQLRMTEAAREYKAGLSSLDRMGERDRLRYLGDYYLLVTGEQERAIEAYQSLLAKWPHDIGAANNLAIAFSSRHDTKRALEVGARATAEHWRNETMRSNLVGFQFYASDFAQAIDGAHQVITDFARPLPNVFEYLALAQLLLGHTAEADAAYALLDGADASWGIAARADRALAEARLSDAEALLAAGMVEDQAKGNIEAAGLKQVMLADVYLRRGDKPKAIATAGKVTGGSWHLFQAAMIRIAAGDGAHAKALAAKLGEEMDPDSRFRGKLLAAEQLRLQGKPQQAILALKEAQQISDDVLGHYYLARAALDAGQFPAAYSELSACLARRGELALGPDDEPQVRAVPPLTYYLARAQEGLASPQAAASYEQFLSLQPQGSGDPLVDDARRRLAALKAGVR